MREIRFRAWHKASRRMFDVNAISKTTVEELRNGVSFRYYRDDVVLMQYTGLKDKYGREIYEGDVVVIPREYIWFDDGKPNYRGTVEWIYSQWQVVAHCVNLAKKGISDGINEGLNDYGWNEGCSTTWEVIGNIHDNPELVVTDDA